MGSRSDVLLDKITTTQSGDVLLQEPYIRSWFL
jgi:hypothetical protein